MKLPAHQKANGSAGFSLLEVLVTVGVIGIVASVGMVYSGDIREKARSQKLVSDVETINRAIAIYEANGGTMEGVNPHPWYVLGKLKSKVAAGKVDESIGLTGSFVDLRLQPIFMNASEIASDAPRAVWDPAERRFALINDNSIVGTKVRGFKLTDDTAEEEVLTQAFLSGIDARDLNAFGYAKDGKWVWDYSDTTAGTAPEPTVVTLLPGVPTTPPPGPGGPPQLDPPIFTLPGGSYPLSVFPAPFKMENPNDPAISEIYYWTEKNGWLLYDGNNVVATPKLRAIAFVKSTDEDNWASSDMVDSAWYSEVATLEVLVTAPVSVTWAEAGGGIQPGGPLPTLAAPGQIGLANAASIPDVFEDSANFTIYWTTDGSDPQSSGTRYEVGAFAGGFPGQSQDVDVAAFGSQTSLPIQAVAVSLEADYFNSSTVVSHTVAINQTTLRTPGLSPVGDIVTIDLETGFGDMPAGARIFYTLDGTDPGDDGSGNPVTGTEYTGPFSVKWLGIANVPVQARVYAPAGYEHWFEVSEIVASTVPVPPVAVSMSQAVSTSAP